MAYLGPRFHNAMVENVEIKFGACWIFKTPFGKLSDSWFKDSIVYRFFVGRFPRSRVLEKF